MMDELASRLERHGGTPKNAPAAPEMNEASLSEKACLVRCLNWQSAALLRYDLAIRRDALHEEDRILLTHHRRLLQDAIHHLAPRMSDSALIAA